MRKSLANVLIRQTFHFHDILKYGDKIISMNIFFFSFKLPVSVTVNITKLFDWYITVEPSTARINHNNSRNVIHYLL